MSVLVVTNVDAIRQIIVVRTIPHMRTYAERCQHRFSKSRPRLKTKAPESRVRPGLRGIGAGWRWGHSGGATPIIETKNEALMPRFRGTFSLLVRCGFRVTVSGGLWRYRSLAGWPL